MNHKRLDLFDRGEEWDPDPGETFLAYDCWERCEDMLVLVGSPSGANSLIERQGMEMLDGS